MSKNVKMYGDIAGERQLKDSIKAREITQEILNFGVNQFQIAKIISLLSLELENREVLQGVCDAIKPLLEEIDDNNSNIITT
tara:strand:- start:373 stop:618 length:246 start_codon:yes stop_codon:yes gene_type:complete